MKIDVSLHEFSVIIESLDRWTNQLMMIGEAEKENVLKLVNLMSKLDEQGLKEVLSE